jgi:hypothetical protein|tara:strand:- start:2078 stop:2518 length:441 start_codon:yes stop_codon:yes gene_type:complete
MPTPPTNTEDAQAAAKKVETPPADAQKPTASLQDSHKGGKTAKKAKAKKKNAFRVLRGSHQEAGQTYRKGDIVKTDNNLLRHNSVGSVKFEQVFGDIPEGSIDGSTPIDAMDLEELLQFANAEEVDLSGLTSRASIVTALKKALGR